jgi:hypothetical protein
MPSELKPEESSINIAGNWNPAILQPSWIARHVFGRQEGENFDITTELSLMPGQPPRFTIDGLKIAPNYNRLVISPAGVEAAQFAMCEEKARAILAALPHTPVSAFGINFQFEDANPSPGVLDLFGDQESLAEEVNFDFEPLSTSVARALKLEKCVLNFTRKLTDSSQVNYKFNFHYTVAGAAAATELLTGAMAANLGIAREIVGIYDAME